MNKLIAGLRIALGWIFLWAGMDKIWGLGYNTAANKGWLDGVSPTTGFLANAPNPWFHSLAGNPFFDWLFIIGLMALGIALFLGIGLKLAAIGGSTMMLLMWLAVWPIRHNPFIDEHSIYALIFLLLPLLSAGRTWGFGRLWSETTLVKKNPWLQ